MANKKAKFECKITNIQKASETKIDDTFAKNMGAKDLVDLRSLIEKQISTQYKQALDSITKKEILDQIEKLHKIELPKNLVEQEVLLMTQQLKKEDPRVLRAVMSHMDWVPRLTYKREQRKKQQTKNAFDEWYIDVMRDLGGIRSIK